MTFDRDVQKNIERAIAREMAAWEEWQKTRTPFHEMLFPEAKYERGPLTLVRLLCEAVGR
jgi:hypothetical protein